MYNFYVIKIRELESRWEFSRMWLSFKCRFVEVGVWFGCCKVGRWGNRILVDRKKDENEDDFLEYCRIFCLNLWSSVKVMVYVERI